MLIAKRERARSGKPPVSFLGREPARAVTRLAPRNASIGSVRVAIHAGAIPKATPAIAETPNANSSTGSEGDASMGTPGMPLFEGNAKCKIRRVPANAIAKPAAPPNNDSIMLSVRSCLTIREARAPSAMLNDVCRRRSIPRTSMRLATLAHTISSTNPVTAHQDLEPSLVYCSRMLAMPAPPGTRNNVCSGKVRARSLRAHFTPMRAAATASVPPALHAFNRPRAERPARCCLSAPTSGVRTCRDPPRARQIRFRVQRQRNIRRSAARRVSPKKPGGATPTTVTGLSSTLEVATDYRTDPTQHTFPAITYN